MCARSCVILKIPRLTSARPHAQSTLVANHFAGDLVDFNQCHWIDFRYELVDGKETDGAFVVVGVD